MHVAYGQAYFIIIISTISAIDELDNPSTNLYMWYYVERHDLMRSPAHNRDVFSSEHTPTCCTGAGHEISIYQQEYSSIS